LKKLNLERLTVRLGLTVIYSPVFLQARPDFFRVYVLKKSSILTASELEREQKFDEAGAREAGCGTEEVVLSLQFTRGQHAEKLFLRRESLLRRRVKHAPHQT